MTNQPDAEIEAAFEAWLKVRYDERVQHSTMAGVRDFMRDAWLAATARATQEERRRAVEIIKPILRDALALCLRYNIPQAAAEAFATKGDSALAALKGETTE